LRLKKAVLTLGHVEDHRMCVELRSGVSVNRPRRVVLERGRDKFPSRFRSMDIADACLREPF